MSYNGIFIWYNFNRGDVKKFKGKENKKFDQINIIRIELFTRKGYHS